MSDRDVIDGATAGPWRYGAIEHGGRMLVDGSGYLFAQVDDGGNGAFIARARTAWPEALNRIEQLEAECERLRGLLPAVVRKLGYLARDYDGDKETRKLIAAIEKELGK
jgi:hypothetical protein